MITVWYIFGILFLAIWFVVGLVAAITHNQTLQNVCLFPFFIGLCTVGIYYIISPNKINNKPIEDSYTGNQYVADEYIENEYEYIPIEVDAKTLIKSYDDNKISAESYYKDEVVS